jgi:hypothetical protein
MGYQRHSQTIVSADIDVPSAAEPQRTRATPADTAIARVDTDVMPQARQMRDEWRRQRYARLTAS